MKNKNKEFTLPAGTRCLCIKDVLSGKGYGVLYTGEVIYTTTMVKDRLTIRDNMNRHIDFTDSKKIFEQFFVTLTGDGKN